MELPEGLNKAQRFVYQKLEHVRKRIFGGGWNPEAVKPHFREKYPFEVFDMISGLDYDDVYLPSVVIGIQDMVHEQKITGSMFDYLHRTTSKKLAVEMCDELASHVEFYTKCDPEERDYTLIRRLAEVSLH